jgi:putative oxidoreductase
LYSYDEGEAREIATRPGDTVELGRKQKGPKPQKEAKMKMPSLLFASRAPAATVLIRLMVGAVFLSEGIQKFLFPDALGVGRFVKIGIPYPEIMAPFVGVFEIGCGSLLILGLLTRLAAIPMVINISVAILSTKIPMLLGHGFWMFSSPKANQVGFWAMAHEARTDFCMLLGGAFLLIVGAGCLSFDALFTKRTSSVAAEPSKPMQQ